MAVFLIAKNAIQFVDFLAKLTISIQLPACHNRSRAAFSFFRASLRWGCIRYCLLLGRSGCFWQARAVSGNSDTFGELSKRAGV